MSKLEYVPLNPKGQAIIVACPMTRDEVQIRERWKERGVALLGDTSNYLRDVVRDLLANPQVRMIVFDGPACGRAKYDEFWYGESDPGWRIDMEHVTLVRRFVDLYDDDFGAKAPMQPFWPSRVRYLEDMEIK